MKEIMQSHSAIKCPEKIGKIQKNSLDDRRPNLPVRNKSDGRIDYF
jgi:hypothetical protein